MIVSLRFVSALLTIAACALVTSCTADDPPAAAYPPTRVLNIDQYEKKPCSLLTDEQFAALGLTYDKDQLQGSGLCSIRGRPDEIVHLTTYVHPVPGSHSPYFWLDAANSYGSWTTIAGQPAVVTSSRTDCWAMLWTAAEQGIEVNIFSNKGKEERDDWCERARAIFEPIVANLAG